MNITPSNVNIVKDVVEEYSLTPFNTNFRRSREELIPSKLPSDTVPNQALTVTEIMTRYAQGRPLTVNNNLTFTGDNYAPDVKKMDLVDLDELKRKVDEDIKDINYELNNPKKPKTPAKAEQADNTAKKSDEAEEQGTAKAENGSK